MMTIDEEDEFGLTISMRAAALGRLDDIVKAAPDDHKARKARIEKRNPRTRANLLHYAAQQPQGGAVIVEWVITQAEASDDLLKERILVPRTKRAEDKDWDRGNGHTVAFEAVFNNNVEVVKALLSLESKGHAVDFTTPAVHGWSPLGWALKTEAHEIASLLRRRLHPDLTIEDALGKEKDSATQEAEREDETWRSEHPNDADALDLAIELRRYVVHGRPKKEWVKDLVGRVVGIGDGKVDPNKPYGRFGQPLLNLVPTHPDIMNITTRTKEQQDRYTDIVGMLLCGEANPMTKEKGLMEVSAGFREVFFGYMDALKLMIDQVDSSKREEFVSERGLFNGYTRLIDAALIGQAQAMGLLLAYNTRESIERCRGFNGWTAHDAAERGSMATAVRDLFFGALVGVGLR